MMMNFAHLKNRVMNFWSHTNDLEENNPRSSAIAHYVKEILGKVKHCENTYDDELTWTIDDRKMINEFNFLQGTNVDNVIHDIVSVLVNDHHLNVSCGCSRLSDTPVTKYELIIEL